MGGPILEDGVMKECSICGDISTHSLLENSFYYQVTGYCCYCYGCVNGKDAGISPTICVLEVKKWEGSNA